MKAVTVYGDFGTNLRIPTVSISVDGFSAEDVKLFMRKRGITVKSGDFNAPRLLKSLGKEQEEMCIRDRSRIWKWKKSLRMKKSEV